ncbi:MAG: hypothetical protein N2442_09795 [Spirochaetes bacterium]|nr:hypothetical protein [Spirochaetota bacterium]
MIFLSSTNNTREKELVLAYERLRQALETNNREVILTIAPYQRDASGVWMIPEKIVPTQFIDFLPAK